MAKLIHVAGIATIKIATGSLGSGTLEELGVTRNGAQITFQEFSSPVPTDEHGGDEGPPVDIQYFGEIATVRLELTKFDAAVAAKVAARLRAGAIGVPNTPGTLKIQGDHFYRLLIHAPNAPYNFPCVVFGDAIDTNKGTKFSTLSITATCYKHPSSGILYNTTTS